MMEFRPAAEKFEAWLQDEDVALVRQHMLVARMRKKSEFTRAALLAGLPRYEFEHSCQIGELALSVNKLATVVATGNAISELRPALSNVKRLTNSLQAQCGRREHRWERYR